ncbi:DEKNAAC102121 [Brettanomyces naardenensis]|uniref:Pantoate--beta-alanine ligase n=1 Tax=Brettanomyces naardenensis TaxID=13370 RepID=A0A448YK36_BRENA|nr:DEKNAAC102121 [Brettanomyces naardenensis]
MTVVDIPVVRTISELRRYRETWRKDGLQVGFIPTMGYLHEGHQSLILRSLEENDVTVVSIFVNPSQFAPGEDLDAYPRNLEHDLTFLYGTTSSAKHRVNLVFAPTVSEMYPSGIPLDVSLQKGAFVNVTGVTEQLEGHCRPAFFRGVSTIVAKLLNVVEPQTAYFGQKDIQQTVVVRKMVSDLFFNTKIVVVPIVRNETGLALSSRNAYLSGPVKAKATVLYKSMKNANLRYVNEKELNVETLTKEIEDEIKGASDEFKVDYVSFNDPEDLHYLDTIDPKKGCFLSMAVYVPNVFGKSGTTRLIDNYVFERQ